MLNSTSTIFTLDIYKQYVGKNASDKTIVSVGRISAAVALIIAAFIAPLLQNLGQAFQFIQEYTGVVSPGILAVFLLGLFWKKTSNRGAIIGALASIPVAMYFKVAPKGWSESTFFVDVPFMDQMGYTLLITMLIIALASKLELKDENDAKGIPLVKNIFKTSPVFNIGAFALMVILTALYAAFWS
jgi:SSS family solute:Na+ symporter